jgi:nucleoside-diphosphate-sugar epimerase
MSTFAYTKMRSNQTIGILGAGWVGLPLAQTLKDLGFNVVTSYQSEKKQKHLESLNLNPLGLKEFFHQADVIISSLPAGTEEVLHQVPQEKYLIQLSSTAVYENQDQIMDEEGPLQHQLPQTQFEKKIHHQHLMIIRLGGLIGYNRHPSRFFIGKSQVQGGNHPTNLIHRDDVIYVLTSLLAQNKFTPGFYNLVADEHPLKKDFYTYACEVIKQPAPHFNLEDRSRNKIISNQKIKNLLNLELIYKNPIDYLRLTKKEQSHLK